MPTTPSRPAAPAGRPTAHSRHHLCQSATAATNAAVLLNGRPSLRSQFLYRNSQNALPMAKPCRLRNPPAGPSRQHLDKRSAAQLPHGSSVLPLRRHPRFCCHCAQCNGLHHCVSTTPERAHACCSSGRPRRARSSGGASSGVAFFGVAPFFFAQWVRANFLSTGSSRCTRPPVHCTAGTAARRRRWTSLPVCEDDLCTEPEQCCS
jgi:hypothetical protein